MNTFVIPIVTLTIMALVGLRLMRNSPEDEDHNEAKHSFK